MPLNAATLPDDTPHQQTLPDIAVLLNVANGMLCDAQAKAACPHLLTAMHAYAAQPDVVVSSPAIEQLVRAGQEQGIDYKALTTKKTHVIELLQTVRNMLKRLATPGQTAQWQTLALLIVGVDALIRLEARTYLAGKVAQSVMQEIALREPCLQLTTAERLMDTVIAHARSLQVCISCSVLDEAGQALLFKRMPGALPISVQMADNKAYTAYCMRMPSHQIGPLAQPGQSLYGIQAGEPRIVIFGGGFPLLRQGKTIGALGVSGGEIHQDMQIATHAIASLKPLLDEVVL